VAYLGQYPIPGKYLAPHTPDTGSRRESADSSGEAGAPEWKKLLAEESAISRMTDRLVEA
jgi:hypothetical protein